MYDGKSHLTFFIKMHTVRCSVVIIKKKYYSETREATAAEGNWQGKSKFVYLSQ